MALFGTLHSYMASLARYSLIHFYFTQFIMYTITTLFLTHYFSLSVFEGLVLQRILLFIDLFLSQRTDSTDSQSQTI